MNIPIEKFSTYLENKNLKPRTIENYLYYFSKFTFLVFDQESVSRFLATKNNRNSVSRSFLINFQKFLTTNYKELGLSIEQKIDVADVELPKLTGRAKVRLIKPLQHEEIAILEKALPDEKWRLHLLLTYYCGLRLGELLKIDALSFNWQEWGKDMTGMGECRVYGKGDKEGIALVPAFLMIRVGRWLKTGKRVFKSPSDKIFLRKGGAHADVKNVGRLWQLKLAKAGVDAGITKFNDDGTPIQDTLVHPHRLRHSYANYLLNVKKLNMREVQEALRHSSITSTEIYTLIDKEELKSKLGDLGE